MPGSRSAGATSGGEREAADENHGPAAPDPVGQCLSELAAVERLTGVGVWQLDAAGRRLLFSPGLAGRLGLAGTFAPLDEVAARFPGAAGALLADACHALAAGGPAFELELALAGGAVLRVTGAPREAGAAGPRGAMHDVSPPLVAELELARLRAMTADQPGLVISCGPDGRVDRVSANVEARTRLCAKAALGCHLADLLHPAEDDAAARGAVRAVLASGARGRVSVPSWTESGLPTRTDLDLRPVRLADGTLVGHLAVESDMVPLREHEVRLAALEREAERARSRLMAAVEVLDDGFVLFDADGRLVICNERYREIYRESAGAMTPGATFEDILRHGLARGQYRDAHGREDAWLEERLALHRQSGVELEQALSDGRWLRIVDKKTPDGGRVGLRTDITRLKEAERRLADIIRGTDAGTWEWNVQTGETVFNERWAAMLGLTLADVTPATLSTWGARIHPDDLETATARMAAHLRGRTDGYACEARLRHADGRWLWVLARGRVGTRTPDGRPEWVYGTAQDIDARKTAETALRASEERFRLLFDAIPDGVVLSDPETLLPVHFNPVAPAMLGYTPEAFARLTIPDRHLGATRESVQARIRKLFDHGRDDFVSKLVRRDGSLVPAAMTLIALPIGGRVLVLAVLRDITELKRQQEALETSRAAAEAASASKSLFLANMSHEIRTPMNGVMGMAEVLSRLVTEPTHRRMVETIRGSGEALLTILDDILDFSKIEAGRLDLDCTAFQPAEIARKVESLHALKAAEKGISLVVMTSSGGDVPRSGDPHRILQILHNLVSNAVKFTIEGEVTVTLACQPSKPLVLEVRDTGIGMTEAEVARLYDDFVQADSSTTRRFGGTGLGMAIVRRLVEMMAGDIRVESRVGAGTTVRVTLPLPAVEPEAPPRDPHAPPVAGLRVLAADDSEINRIVLSEILRMSGAKVEMLNTGAEAVEAVGSGPHDVILLDISMPGMDGIETLRAIRAKEARLGLAPTPVIAVTANALKHQVELYLASGFDGHVGKPIRPEALAGTIALAVARSPRQSPNG